MKEIKDDIKNWCFFDLETTGVDKAKDGIVQVALSRMVNGVSHTFQTLVNPLMPIPAEATAVHHITDAMVADAPTLAEIAPKIIAFFKGSKGDNPTHVGGQNIIGFDVPFLEAKLADLGYESPFSNCKGFLDTLKIEAMYNPRDLGTLYKKYTGAELDGAHDAMVDVYASESVFMGQMAKYGFTLEEVSEAIKGECLDYSGYLKLDGNTLVFARGKHNGKPVASEPGYVNWMKNTRAATAQTFKMIEAYENY